MKCQIIHQKYISDIIIVRVLMILRVATKKVLVVPKQNIWVASETNSLGSSKKISRAIHVFQFVPNIKVGLSLSLYIYIYKHAK